MAGGYLLFHKTICGFTVGSIHHTVFDRQPVGRQFIEHRNMQIAVQNDGQRPRDRRCAHNKHMHLLPLLRQTLPLAHTETVLFVRDHQRQIMINDFVLNQCMGAEDDVRLPALDLRIDLSALFCGGGTSQQHGTDRQLILLLQLR